MVYLAGSKALMLVDDSQVLFHPLWVEVFGGTGLQLKSILLEILKPATKKHSVCRVNCLDAVLRKHSNFDLYIVGPDNRDTLGYYKGP